MMKFKLEKLCRRPVTNREQPDTQKPGRQDKLLGILVDGHYRTLNSLADEMQISNQEVSNLFSQLGDRHVFEWRFIGRQRAYRWVQERNHDG